MKYVYLIQATNTGNYKIGASKHPQKRLNEIQTGNDSPIILIHKYPSTNAFQIEGILKRKYKYCRTIGEWFNLSLDNVVGFMDDCKKIEDTITFLKKSDNEFL